MQITPVLFSLFCAAVVVFSARYLAPILGLLDHPSVRKQHVGSVPLMGGIALFIGAWMGLLIAFGSIELLIAPFSASLMVSFPS